MCVEVINGMADTIADLERKLAEREWIPVSERLSEDGVKVLCCDKHGDIYFGCHENTGWYWEAEACADYWTKDPTVIAWQPLPEPYKGGDTK